MMAILPSVGQCIIHCFGYGRSSDLFSNGRLCNLFSLQKGRRTYSLLAKAGWIRQQCKPWDLLGHLSIKDMVQLAVQEANAIILNLSLDKLNPSIWIRRGTGNHGYHLNVAHLCSASKPLSYAFLQNEKAMFYSHSYVWIKGIVLLIEIYC